MKNIIPENQRANAMTILGLILTIIAFPMAMSGLLILQIPALIMYVGAAATDYFDGQLANKYDSHSHLGGILDQLRDKLLGILSFVSAMSICVNPLGKVLLGVPLLFETGMLLGGGYIKLVKKIPIATIDSGKYKTVILFLTMIMGYIFALNSNIIFTTVFTALLGATTAFQTKACLEYLKEYKKLKIAKENGTMEDFVTRSKQASQKTIEFKQNIIDRLLDFRQKLVNLKNDYSSQKISNSIPVMNQIVDIPLKGNSRVRVREPYQTYIKD